MQADHSPEEYAELRQRAEKRLRAKRALRIHGIAFGIGNFLLATVNTVSPPSPNWVVTERLPIILFWAFVFGCHAFYYYRVQSGRALIARETAIQREIDYELEARKQQRGNAEKRKNRLALSDDGELVPEEERQAESSKGHE